MCGKFLPEFNAKKNCVIVDSPARSQRWEKKDAPRYVLFSTSHDKNVALHALSKCHNLLSSVA